MSRVTHNILGIMFIVTAVGSIGQLLLKIGMSQAADKAPSLMGIVKIMATEPRVLCGLVLFALNTVLYLRVLQQYPLSVVYPMIAFSYVEVSALSWLLLGERISPVRILGLSVIVLGVLILSFGAPEKEKLHRLTLQNPAASATLPPDSRPGS
jgi:uncharacterized membrane protein